MTLYKCIGLILLVINKYEGHKTELVHIKQDIALSR